MAAVTIVDSGICNLGSIARALERAGAKVAITAEPDGIGNAERLILPGVGSFPAAMKALNERKLVGPVREFAAGGKPVLGICLGMQLLLHTGEEFGETKGLGLIPGRCTAIDAQGQRVPHMGWNEITATRKDPLLAGVDHRYFYFVHSFVCRPAEKADILATTEYGEQFCSVLRRGNVWGAQFHPEKSQQAGLRLLKNFLGAA